jgi:hypothetical protein
MTTLIPFAPGYVPANFWEAWLLSPGAGATAIAAAALIALAGVITTVAVQSSLAKKDRALRDIADQRENWWERAQWALNLVIDGDDRKVRGAHAFLAQLAASDLAGVHQAELITAITDLDLDNYSITVSNGVVTISTEEADQS